MKSMNIKRMIATAMILVLTLGCTAALAECSCNSYGSVSYAPQYTGYTYVSSYTPSYYTSAGSFVLATGGKSYVRSGPGLYYNELGTLHEGEGLTYLGCYSIDERGVAWYNVCYYGSSCWISSRYTTLYC
ncbi:MAG: SH3 domain-containing protein [Aristaeellaceae bacterium]|nr:SH3 domain-containing protein [Eubacteriales bacterium]